MRMRSSIAAIGVALTMAVAGTSAAEAGGWYRPDAVSHTAYAAPQAQVYYVGRRTYGPYEYYGRAPRYYPYYNSGYWRPLNEMRYRPRTYYAQPPYYPAWGYPVGNCYKKYRGCKKRRSYHRYR